jgi:NAD(P)-dependent dehydrogenase (short-subunit alcohol dehydrogenase family)
MLERFSLKDKTIVVTGGTGVLGGAFIEAIVQSGGRVAILGRNRAVAEERAHAICQSGGQAVAVIADVLKQEDLERASLEIQASLGPIHGLVNAAGGNIPQAVLAPDADIFSLDTQALEAACQLNLMGTVLPTQVFGKSMAAAGGGSIVNISSVSASRALTRVLGYSLGKAAVEAYTRWMAVELANRYGDKIRINAVVPGFFLTEQNRTLLKTDSGEYTDRAKTILRQTPFSRLGDPEELQGALIWLLSDAARFVSGTIVPVDGGFSAFSGV